MLEEQSIAWAADVIGRIVSSGLTEDAGNSARPGL